MHRLLSLYFLLTGIIFANVVLKHNTINLKDFNISYYIDKNKSMNFNMVKHQDFLLAPNQKSFSHNDTHLWLKIKVNNQSSKQQKLFLHHHNAYRLKHITFFETKDNKLLNSFDMNMSNTQDTHHMVGTDAIYKFTLEVNESKTIYVQATSFIYQYYSLMLFDEKHSIQYSTLEHLPIIVILSILIGLMFYHLILYFMTLFTDYLYYSLYLLFNFLWGSYEYGLLSKYLGWYGEAYAGLHFLVVLSVIFLGFFIKKVLQLPKLYPSENKVMNFAIGLFVINLSYVWIDMEKILFVIVIFMNIVAIIYMGVIVSLYRKKAELISYIIVAQVWLITFGYIGFGFYQGFIEYNFWTRYSYILGILLDTFAFAYLLSHRIKILQEESKKSKEQTKRIQALSELLENISHQWRQPLTRINSSVMHISIEMRKNKIINLNIDKKLDNIENLSVYLSKTIDDFKSLYRQDREMSHFNLKDSIKESIALMDNDYAKHNIEITMDVSKNIHLHNYKSELNQVLQVILNNAKDALLANNTERPYILILAEKKEKQILLKISNNGGEIDSLVMDQIFNANFTTKKEGEGIGLFMAQKILQELMNANLTCYNLAGGVCFEIKFKT